MQESIFCNHNFLPVEAFGLGFKNTKKYLDFIELNNSNMELQYSIRYYMIIHIK